MKLGEKRSTPQKRYFFIFPWGIKAANGNIDIPKANRKKKKFEEYST